MKTATMRGNGLANAGRIVVSYAGVHQAYQLALAAQEMGELKAFYCSLYDAPKKWGGLIAGLVGHDVFASRRVAGLDLEKVIEYPWPLLWKIARDKVDSRGRDNWLSLFNTFDRWVAKRIEMSPPDIFVGTASSDLNCLTAAKRHGSTLVHDCPGLHPLFQARLLHEAADRAGIRTRKARTRLGGVDARKLLEYSMADALLVYSDIHRKSFEVEGYPTKRLFMSPLWVDTGAWYREAPKHPENAAPKGPLKLLFVGSIELRKGIPFLLKAVAACETAVQLTIVGARNSQSMALLGPERENVRYLSPQSKSQLRKTYEAHEVLVLPSVGDSFGFVALEAMACGLPVIVTQNCGVPVPDSSWRVPAMDSGTLAKRIMQYADDRTLVAEHGERAVSFAAQYGPQNYRRNIRVLFEDILDSRN
jgi:glycosyltransferase involved in cell wall biosynthesis